MLANDRRCQRRPRIELVGIAESHEAAAVTAAIEQFLIDTAPAPATARPFSRWQRTALLEGAGAKAIFGTSSRDKRDPWL